ncbi:UNVERIFIED_CONTAM: putative membrane protein [Williamsia faeni]
MTFDEFIARTGQAIDCVGVAAIVMGALVALGVAAVRFRRHEPNVYSVFRQWLGRSILLGLELLVAADIIRTVATRPTMGGVAILAGIVLIRTFLSFSLELEISGRWPWQKAPTPTPRPRTTA